MVEGSWGVGATGSAGDDHAAREIHDLASRVCERAVVSSTRCICCQPLGSGTLTSVVEAPPNGGGWSRLVCLYLGGQLAMMTRQGKGSRWLVLGCASLLLLQQQQRSTCCRVAAAGPDPSPWLYPQGMLCVWAGGSSHAQRAAGSTPPTAHTVLCQVSALRRCRCHGHQSVTDMTRALSCLCLCSWPGLSLLD